MDMLEIDMVYKRGWRTFMHTLLVYGWWLLLLGIANLYIAYSLYMGPLSSWAASFLSELESMIITNDIVAMWFLLISSSFFAIAYIRTQVLFRQYKFTLDEHAFRLQRGLFRIREYTFPYTQVANVHIEQPYHWRALGLASLDIISSSDADYGKGDGHGKNTYLIPVIDRNLAKLIRHQVMRYGSGLASPLDDMYEEVEEDENEEAEEDVVPEDTRPT